jgi:hypothetical protein
MTCVVLETCMYLYQFLSLLCLIVRFLILELQKITKYNKVFLLLETGYGVEN